MKHYKVQATHDGATRLVRIEAVDSMDATMQAISVVLDSAMHDQVWARGEVTLVDGNGRVLHRMEAKG